MHLARRIAPALGLGLLLLSVVGIAWYVLRSPQQVKTSERVSGQDVGRPPTIYAIIIDTPTPQGPASSARPTSTRATTEGGAPTRPAATPRPPSGAPAPTQALAMSTLTSVLGEKSGGAGIIGTAIPTPRPPSPRVIDAEWPRTLEKGRTGTVRISLVETAAGMYTPVVSAPNNTTLVGTPVTLGTPGADLSVQFGANYDAYVSANLAGAAFTIDSLVKEPQSLEQPDITWTWSVLAKEERTQTLDARINIEWRPRGGGTPVQRTLWRSQFAVEVGQPVVPMDLLGVFNAFTAFAGTLLSGPWVIDKVIEVVRARRKQGVQRPPS